MNGLLFILGFMLVLAGINDEAAGRDTLIAVVGLLLLCLAMIKEKRHA